ncbi:MAG: PHP domain-containing protein [Chloroflexota bacterium]
MELSIKKSVEINEMEFNKKFRVDFHCHTHYSRDSLTKPENLVKMCHRKGLGRIVITDHNSIAGALEAHNLDPFHIIVGEEIMTTCGEILAAFVQECVPAGLTQMQTIQLLRDQGAFISISHPFDKMRKGS